MLGPPVPPMSSRLPSQRGSQQGAAPQEAKRMEDNMECPPVALTAAPSRAGLGPGHMLDCMPVHPLSCVYWHSPLHL